jgi:hypothetical protein
MVKRYIYLPRLMSIRERVTYSQVSRRLRTQNALEQLDYLFIYIGLSEHIRSDNGPELAAKAVRNYWSD